MAIQRQCLHCGDGFTTHRSQVKRGGGKFCSRDCVYAYQRSEPVEDRFWRKVDRRGADQCWPWTGATTHGYGMLKWSSDPDRTIHAHRASLLIHGTEVPDDAIVMHACDNRPCVNPAHLRVGTQADNLQDMAEKGRSQQGESHWNAKLSPDDVREIRRLYATGDHTYDDLSSRFPVSRSMAHLIVTRQRWCHID